MQLLHLLENLGELALSEILEQLFSDSVYFGFKKSMMNEEVEPSDDQDDESNDEFLVVCDESVSQ